MKFSSKIGAATAFVSSVMFASLAASYTNNVPKWTASYVVATIMAILVLSYFDKPKETK